MESWVDDVTGWIVTQINGAIVSSMSQHFEVLEDDCIGCRLCVNRAPENLAAPDGERIPTVTKQPETPAQEEACREASDYCPTGGLRASDIEPTPTVSSANDAKATFLPDGDSTPADSTPTR